MAGFKKGGIYLKSQTETVSADPGYILLYSKTDGNIYKSDEHGLETTININKAHLPLNVLDYGAIPDNTTNSTIGIKAALAAVSGNGGGTVYIPNGTYFCSISGDNDTILIPANCSIIGDPGTILRWNYWGSPLLAIIESKNTSISNVQIQWGGNFGTTSSSRSFLNYTRAVPAYHWCSNIVILGSNDAHIQNIKMFGSSTTNNQNVGIYYAGPDDGVSVSTGFIADKLWLDDLNQGILIEGASEFGITNLYSSRHSQQSVGLYGPGHLIYDVTSVQMINGKISNIYDYGVCNDTESLAGHTLSLKSLKNVIVTDVVCSRSAGPLNCSNCNSVIFSNFKFSTPSISANANLAACFYTGQGSTSSDISFSNINLFWSANASCAHPAFSISNDPNPPEYVTVNNLVIRRYTTGVEVPSIIFGATDSSLDATIIHDGIGSPRQLLNLRPTADRNTILIRSTGSNPGVSWYGDPGYGVNNRVTIRVDTSDTWIKESEVENLTSRLSSIISSTSPILNNSLTIYGTAPALYMAENGGAFDFNVVMDNGILKYNKCVSSISGNGDLIDTVASMTCNDGSFSMGRLTGGTYNGNSYFSASDSAPGFRFRSGSTAMGGVVCAVSTGTMYIDITLGQYLIVRDGEGGPTILSCKKTTSQFQSGLAVTVSSPPADPAVNETRIAGGIIKTATVVISPKYISSVPTGTPPFSAASTTLNPNLNADLLDDQHGSYYTPIATTAATSGNLVTNSTNTAIAMALIFG